MSMINVRGLVAISLTIAILVIGRPLTGVSGMAVPVLLMLQIYINVILKQDLKEKQNKLKQMESEY